MFCFFFGLVWICGVVFFFVCLFLFVFVFLLVLEYFTLCRCDEIFFLPEEGNPHFSKACPTLHSSKLIWEDSFQNSFFLILF